MKHFKPFSLEFDTLVDNHHHSNGVADDQIKLPFVVPYFEKNRRNHQNLKSIRISLISCMGSFDTNTYITHIRDYAIMVGNVLHAFVLFATSKCAPILHNKMKLPEEKKKESP